MRGVAREGEENDTIILSGIVTNIGDQYNTSTGAFTCETPGLYYFFASIEKQMDVSEAYCHIQVNGENKLSIAARSAFTDSESYIQSSNSALVLLKEGDSVRLGGCSAPGTITENSSFGGYLVQ